jgi:hypothetical protein
VVQIADVRRNASSRIERQVEQDGAIASRIRANGRRREVGADAPGQQVIETVGVEISVTCP